MADINFSINAQVSKGSFVQAINLSGITANMATAGVASVTLELDTSTTAINTATLGAVGYCFARSLATETTHTVSFGRLVGTNLYDSVSLKAGEAAWLRLSAGDYAAKSAVNGSRILLTIYED